jgi:hypothetical protein
MTAGAPVLLAAACLMSACGGGDAEVPPDAGYNCAADERADDLVAGLEKVGQGGMTFRLVSVTPATPIRGDNTFVLAIDDADGEPLADAAVDVATFMPDHGHSNPIPVEITAGGQTGEYQAEPVNLWMPGLFEVTVAATPAGGGLADEDEVVFRICIAQ